MATEVIAVVEATRTINWTIIWAVLAAIIPMSLATMGILIRIYGKKDSSEELKGIQKTVDENKINCEK